MQILVKNKVWALMLTVCFLIAGSIWAQKSMASSPCLDAKFGRSDIRFSPNPLRVGKRCDVVVKMQNVGDVRWSGREYRLKCKVHRTPSGGPGQIDDFTPDDIYCKAPVNPTEKTEFHYSAVAPSYPGEYTLIFTMVHGREEFGDKVDFRIEVKP